MIGMSHSMMWGKRVSDPIFTKIDISSASVKYLGSTFSPSDGNIYAANNQFNSALRIDTSDETGLSVPTEGRNYNFPNVAPNGDIYLSAYGNLGNRQFAKSTPPGDFLEVGTVMDSSTLKFAGLVLAPNGKLYTVPQNYGFVQEIDPATDTVVDKAAVAGGTNKFRGGVLAENGFIYFIPRSSSVFGKYNPVTDTYTTHSAPSGANKYAGGTVALNGKIYCVPQSANHVLKIDPDTDTFTTIPLGAIPTNYYTGQLAPNGKIYCPSLSTVNVLVIDPSTDTVEVFDNTFGSMNHTCSSLAPNGKIYMAPQSQDYVLIIDNIGDAIPSDFVIPAMVDLAASRYNKFHNKA